jgi:riboflavin kinase/FMN adenylyltransferase
MRIVRSLDTYQADADLMLTIGVFDGVHIGHRAVLKRLAERRNSGAKVGALTFTQHPQEFLHPGQGPKVLTTVDEKVNLLDACGLDVLFLLTFDARIQQLSPEQFLGDVLLKRLRTKRLVVGDNWRFGKDRAGDVAVARQFLEANGCTVETADLMTSDGHRVSSSRIRELIEQRRFHDADALLGAPYIVRGVVTAGDGRGHTLGFPTANLAVAPEKLLPPSGVYGAIAQHEGRDWTAVVSIGDKPTFGGTHLVVEAYVIDFNRSIYGEQLALRDWSFIREQQRYDGAGALVEQMRKDVAQVAAAYSRG